MSKGNLFLGLATGKIGSVVLYRAFGEERARSWVASKRNPRTWRQALQRSIMKTCQVAYSSLMPICRESFQGFGYGTPSQAAFVSRNYRLLRSRVQSVIDAGRDAVLESAVGNYNGAGDEQFLVNTLMVSDGGLPSLEYGAFGEYLELSSAPMGEAPSYADVVRALGCQRGDRLDVIVIGGSAGVVQQFVLGRIILEPAGGDMDTIFAVDGYVNQPNAGNRGDLAVRMEEDGGEGLYYICFPLSSVPLYGGAVVLSRKFGDLWQFSPQFLSISGDVLSKFPLGTAVASFTDLSSVYLDGGG